MDVHDIHVWSITSGLEAMSGHIAIRPGANAKDVLSAVTQIARQDFGIQHTTIQIDEQDPQDSK